MFGVGSAFDSDAEYGFGFFDGNPKIAMMIRNDESAVFVASFGHFVSGESLSTVMSSGWSASAGIAAGATSGAGFFEQLSLLHVEASREFVREFLIERTIDLSTQKLIS